MTSFTHLVFCLCGIACVCVSEALLLPPPPNNFEPALHEKLRQAGFRQASYRQKRGLDESFRESAGWTVVDMNEGTFSDSVVYNMGNGRLQSRPPITLPRAQLRVVVAMHVPRVEHYTLLEELASMSPHVHVVIHCARWDDTFASTYRDTRWTVVIESSGEPYFR